MPNADGSTNALLIEEVDQIVSNEMPTIQFLGLAAMPKGSLAHGHDVIIIRKSQ